LQLPEASWIAATRGKLDCSYQRQAGLQLPEASWIAPKNKKALKNKAKRINYYWLVALNGGAA